MVADAPSTPERRPEPASSSPAESGSARERYGTFYVIYIGLFVLLIAYLMSVRLAEVLLEAEFQGRVDRAIVVADFDQPVSHQMKQRIERAVRASRWVRIGGVHVTILVLAQDGITWLYVDGHGTPVPPDSLAPSAILSEWMDYLPASAQVSATLPHNALVSNLILIVYASILLLVVYRSHRRISGAQSERLNAALAGRNAAARRAEEIDTELRATRSRLSEIEPLEREYQDEIEDLQGERAELNRKLASLASREEALRGRAAKAVDLAQEVRALEDLLEEATGDLETKDDEIGRLEQSLRKASKRAGSSASTRTKAADLIARRFRTLYKTIEVDSRAMNDIAALGDESLRLKAEECVKRLADEADNVAVRRKVGGLPDHVQVYELGFAGKGRIYYTRGKTRRFRILLVGAKNTQPSDLDYLSRLSRDEFA